MAGAITSGMDVGQVRQLATDMSRAADEIQRLGQQITAKLASVPWQGADQKRFEQDWHTHQAQLKTIVDALKKAGQDATRNAQEQESASSH
jgi:uncharacterized protein YukE